MQPKLDEQPSVQWPAMAPLWQTGWSCRAPSRWGWLGSSVPSLAFWREALPEVSLAASELQKELVSTKGTPPAFALPEFSLLLGRGSLYSLRISRSLVPCCQGWVRY